MREMRSTAEGSRRVEGVGHRERERERESEWEWDREAGRQAGRETGRARRWERGVWSGALGARRLERGVWGEASGAGGWCGRVRVWARSRLWCGEAGCPPARLALASAWEAGRWVLD